MSDEAFDDWYQDWKHEDPVGVETRWGEGWRVQDFYNKYLEEKDDD